MQLQMVCSISMNKNRIVFYHVNFLATQTIIRNIIRNAKQFLEASQEVILLYC